MIELFQRAIFEENLALSFFLGMCTYLAVSKRLDTALGVGVALILVQSISVPLNHLLDAHLLSAGALTWLGLPDVDLGFMRLLTFIGIVAGLVQVIEMLLDRYMPGLYRSLGIYLPLLAINCAIIGEACSWSSGNMTWPKAPFMAWAPASAGHWPSSPSPPSANGCAMPIFPRALKG
jgi:Na+-transporting NADH:ubiquinone oxidoreductase subunit E